MSKRSFKTATQVCNVNQIDNSTKNAADDDNENDQKSTFDEPPTKRRRSIGKTHDKINESITSKSNATSTPPVNQECKTNDENINSTSNTNAVANTDEEKSGAIMVKCICCEESFDIENTTQCECCENNFLCNHCKDSEYDLEEWLQINLKCEICEKIVCHECLITCYDCANDDEMNEIVCMDCKPKNLVQIDCDFHEWWTCGKHKNDSDRDSDDGNDGNDNDNQENNVKNKNGDVSNECGQCRANRSYHLRYSLF